jgi:hypothetical protein
MRAMRLKMLGPWDGVLGNHPFAMPRDLELEIEPELATRKDGPTDRSKRPPALPVCPCRRSRVALLLICGAMVISDVPASWAQRSSSAPAVASPRRATARHVTESPVIDGVLDERVWQLAEPITEFVQAEPFEGEPASERTEVRLLYDEQAVYVGVICFDRDPAKIVTTDSRRDSPLSDMDSFEMIFDTYHDRQNGFIFGTNAVGIEYDAQVRIEDIQSGGAPTIGRTQTGSGAGLNVNWDGSWEVKARVTEFGWVAEFRIPLRTLRYGPPPQSWGVNFWRNIGRKREQVYWSPVSRAYTLSRLSSAGELTGLDLKLPRNLKLMPYVTASADRSFAPDSRTQTNRDWGLDAKVSLTSSVNADLTYNTDFAQVEVDEQQINLTRFNIVFPEKRPFFLENQGLFAVGKNGKVDLFFSRRIGIADDLSLVPIRGGVRVSGQAGGMNVGLMDMQTERSGNILANNFFVARVSKDLPNRSSVGGIAVNRSATGGDAGLQNWNRTWGVDGKLGVGDGWTLNGFAARTETPGREGRERAYSSAVEFKNNRRRGYLEYTEVGEDFNPEVGFLERSDGFREVRGGWYFYVRSKALARAGIREWQPHATYDSYWGFDGLQETSTLHIDGTLDWENGNHFSTAFNTRVEGLRTPFQVYPGVIVPAGRYQSPYFFFLGNSDHKKWISGDFGWQYGGFLSGHQNAISPTVTVRRGATLTTALRWTRADVILPQGQFMTNLGALRVTYNFTPLVNAQSLIQYNDLTKRWSTNLRFSWQRSAATGLYVVYNDTEAFNGLGPADRAVILKYSHLIDVLR